MIIPSMTYKEMYDNLAADKYKVDIKTEYLRPKAVKAFKSASTFPAWAIFDYKIPATNNHYVIFFYAENRVAIDKPTCDSFCILFDGNKRLIIKGGVARYKHAPNNQMLFIRQIHAFTSHFLQRYNERILKDKSLNSTENVCRFLSRNTELAPIMMNEHINRNYDKYGDYGQQAYRVRDGICFAKSAVQGIISEDGDRGKDKIESSLVIYTTFMNESEMAKDQRTAIDKEHSERFTQYVDDLLKESKDGILTLRLEP